MENKSDGIEQQLVGPARRFGSGYLYQRL